MTSVGKRPLLHASGLVKRYPGVVALDDVDFELRPGEVHALLGENGAGKSTLVKILTGVESADEGQLIVEGTPTAVQSPRHAQDLGIAVIYQEVTEELVPSLTVAENIFLGREPRRARFLINWQRMNADAAAILARLGVERAFRSLRISDLGVGEKQTVGIAKALSLDSNIVIMDEPSAALSHRESEAVFDIVRVLRDAGAGIVYISHRLEEIFEVADRVTVLRDGKQVGTTEVADVDRRTLVQMMVGRELKEQFPREDADRSKEPTVSVRGLTAEDGSFSNIDFDLFGGEVLGVYGIAGCGNRPLIRALFGLEPTSEGSVSLQGTPIQLDSPSVAIDAGVAFVSDDRKVEGLLLNRSLRENISAPALDTLVSFGVIQRSKEERLARAQVDQLDIRATSIEQLLKYLSGGNQQKTVLAKWLSSHARVFLFNEPTQGIDVGAKVEIYRLINDLKTDGAAVLVVSSDIMEVIGITDRLLVMRRGSVLESLDPRSPGVTQADVFAMASGEGVNRGD